MQIENNLYEFKNSFKDNQKTRKNNHISRKKETHTLSCRAVMSTKRKLHCKCSVMEVKVPAKWRTS
jgi:hypothetical protein